MLYLLISVALLFASIWLGIEMSQANNYVLITYNNWVIEASVWVSLAVIFILFIAFYFLLRLISRSMSISKRYRLWKKSWRERKAQALTQAGLCELAEGQWGKAENKLSKAAKLSRKPLISYLGAATAANAQHAFDRRENYLRLAHNSNKQAAIAIGVTQAKLQLETEQWEQALSTLQHLNQLSPNHGHILKLLLEINVRLAQWEKSRELLALVKKHKAITKKTYGQYEHLINLELLKSIANKGEDTSSFWHSLPKQQRDERLTVIYVNSLLEQQNDDAALNVITKFLKNNWSQQLLQSFSQTNISNTKKLEIAESWLTHHPQDATLLTILGQLSSQERLWGKAKAYLLQSIQLQPSIAAYRVLIDVYQQLNETDKIASCYRHILQLIS